MRIAIVAAGFTPDEADGLRRAMATFRKTGTIHSFEAKLVDGMVARGYDRDFAERCFKQIEGFGEYGFPESHAASFALLVYVSAWLKRHYPAAFACALLNSQPMGFYAPAQIVRDARDHGVEVRPVDVNVSQWDCTLEPAEGPDGTALRLGFRQIKGFKEENAEALVAARGNGYVDGSAGLARRAALWAVRALGPEPLPLFADEPDDAIAEAAVTLPEMALGEQVIEDYTALRLSLKAHPLRLLRPPLEAQGVVPTARLAELRDGRRVTVAGLVICRQRPGTASGVIFATLEDETGIANLIVWPKVFERHRRAVLRSRLMAATGTLQREGLVIHVIVDRLSDLSGLLEGLAEVDATAVRPLARADEPTKPGRDSLGGRNRRDRLFPSRDFH
jgi:error-prone DNA polymerase